MNSGKGFVMSHPALLLKKHLTNIYARIDKIDRELAEFKATIKDGINNLGREKLPVEEFREFVDEFNEALAEGLSSLGEPVREPAKEEIVQEIVIEEPKKQPAEVIVQAVASGSQQQQTEETEELQNEKSANKENGETTSVESPARTEVTDQNLVEKLSKKYLHPEQALNYWIDLKMRRGKTREQAIKEIEEENT
jgi:hypothetical protein